MRLSVPWSAAPASLVCGPADVHVWLVDLAHASRHNFAYFNILSETERIHVD